MVDQEIIDLPNDDAQPSDSGLFIPLQKNIADTRRRSLNNIIPLMQTPWLQTVDANNHNLTNVNSVNSEFLNLTRTSNIPVLTCKNISHGATSTFLRIIAQGDPSTAEPAGQEYGRISLISEDNADGDESGRINFNVTNHGVARVGLEVSGIERLVKILGGFALDLGTHNIQNAGLLNTHTIPSGIADTFAMLAATQTLQNKTLDQPSISDFTNAVHNHEDAASGGTLSKSTVGLSNVDNTSDLSKPISTLTQTALDGKEDSLGFTPENIVNRDAANGYAPLDANSRVPVTNLGSGTPDTTKFLRDDGTFVTPPDTQQTPWEQSIDAADFNLNNVNQVNAKFLSITASDLNIPFLEATHNNPSNGSTLFRNEANTGTHVYTKMDIIAASITPDSEESRTEWHESTLGVLLLAMELRGDTKTLKMNNDYDIDLDTSNLLNVHTMTIQHIRNIEGGFVNPISQNELNGPTSTIYRHDFLGAPSTAQSNGQLYGRMAIISQDNVDGAEYAKMNLDVVKNGALEIALEIDGENSQIKLFNNFELNLDNNNIQNAVLVAPDIADYTNAAHNHEDAASGGKLDTLFTWAATDEDSPLPPDDTELYITEPADKDRTITDVIAGLKNAATGSLVDIEIQLETAMNSNTFLLAAILRIEINEFTSQSSPFTPVITDGNWSEGKRIKIILLQKDSSNAATGLKVTVIA